MAARANTIFVGGGRKRRRRRKGGGGERESKFVREGGEFAVLLYSFFLLGRHRRKGAREREKEQQQHTAARGEREREGKTRLTQNFLLALALSQGGLAISKANASLPGRARPREEARAAPLLGDCRGVDSMERGEGARGRRERSVAMVDLGGVFDVFDQGAADGDDDDDPAFLLLLSRRRARRGLGLRRSLREQ